MYAPWHAHGSYVLVCCMGTGKPWSEHPAGHTWETFQKDTYPSIVCSGTPSEGQDQEFCCAYPTRSGSNSMIKAKAVCGVEGAHETPRLIVSVRKVLFPERYDDVVHSEIPGDYPSKSWIAVWCDRALELKEHLSSDRRDPCRRKASDLSQCLSSDALRDIRSYLDASFRLLSS